MAPGIATVEIQGKDGTAAAFAASDQQIQDFARRATANLGPLGVEITELSQRQKEMDQAVALGKLTRDQYAEELRTLTADARALAQQTATGSVEQQRLATIAGSAQSKIVGLGTAEKRSVDGFEALAAGVRGTSIALTGNFSGAAEAAQSTLQRFFVGSPGIVGAIGGIGALVSIVGLLGEMWIDAGKKSEEAAKKQTDSIDKVAQSAAVALSVSPAQRLAQHRRRQASARTELAGIPSDIDVPMAVEGEFGVLNRREIDAARGVNTEYARRRDYLSQVIESEGRVVGRSEANLRANEATERSLAEQKKFIDYINEHSMNNDALDRPMSTREAVQRARFSRLGRAPTNEAGSIVDETGAVDRGPFAAQPDRDQLRLFSLANQMDSDQTWQQITNTLPNLDDVLHGSEFAEAMNRAQADARKLIVGLGPLRSVGVEPMELMADATKAVADGYGAALETVSKGGHVFDSFLRAVLGSIASEARAKAVMELAEGFAALANPIKAFTAPLHFKAAAIYGAASALAGAGAAAVGGGGAIGGAGGSSVGSATTSSTGSASRGPVTVYFPAELIDLPRGRAARDWIVGMLQDIGVDNVIVRDR